MRAIRIWPLAALFGFVTAGCADHPPGLSPSPGLTISCPPAQTVQAVGDSAVVAYPPATAAGGVAPVAVACAPLSGSTFPPGTTAATCVAVDSRQQSTFCTFPITVVSAPRISATRFVAFGNSITEGKLASGAIISNAYPADLQVLLRERYTAQSVVVLNEGRGGELTAQGVARLAGVLSADNPDVLLLLEGTNDLSAANGAPSAVAPMIENLRSMVRMARSRNVRVFLATLTPVRAGGLRSGGSALVPESNDQIRLLAATEGAQLVDLYQGFGGSPDPYIDIDGLHPNEMGYQKMAQLFFEAIRARLEVANGPTGFQLVNLLVHDPGPPTR